MTGTIKNRLVTPELEKAIKDYPLYSQDSKEKDAVCIAMFSIGSAKWYVLEGQETENDLTLYGIVVGLFESEYGYFSINEMSQITIDASRFGLGRLYIEQKRDFETCRLSEIEDEELQRFLSRMYDK